MIKLKTLISEVKVGDVRKAYIDTSSEIEKARKELDAAQAKFNKLYAEAGKEGDKLQKKFMSDVEKELKKILNVSRISSSGSLIEAFVDKGNGKVTVHFQPHVGASSYPVTFMVRDERWFDNVQGVLDDGVDSKNVGKFLKSQIELFEKKYRTDIKWFKK